MLKIILKFSKIKILVQTSHAKRHVETQPVLCVPAEACTSSAFVERGWAVKGVERFEVAWAGARIIMRARIRRRFAMAAATAVGIRGVGVVDAGSH